MDGIQTTTSTSINQLGTKRLSIRDQIIYENQDEEGTHDDPQDNDRPQVISNSY